MRIFLSHKKEDEQYARRIALYLDTYGVPYYLDALDEVTIKDPGKLTQYLQKQVRESTHLMAIISQRTTTSWWVPFEIGLATECGNPISTYLLDNVIPPEYLRVWPVLRTFRDLELYIHTLLARMHMYKNYLNKSLPEKRMEAEEFHRSLKAKLGQY